VVRLLNLFVDICLLRARPQNLPSSRTLLWLTGAASLFTGTLVIIEGLDGLGRALLAQLLDLALLLGLLRLALSATARGGRFRQTASALFGTSTFINMVTMPLQLTMRGDPSSSLFGELAAVLYLIIIVWALLVMGHILRHAFEIRLGAANLIALGYFFMINWLIQTLFF